ncbi:hypothetical protein [Catenovulum adriaticum]|uniref:Uncharacterized protein n=1 Tax=Catenovulum adriaticum TaxID=2984846 RepID=A0ABY7AMQ9_9ALTE|nr:hypothetical protein [Catenovulum sp. TS8]WAJ69745.1 hypothetical protein OLW01_11350 [Catenovulum sp. TS8]
MNKKTDTQPKPNACTNTSTKSTSMDDIMPTAHPLKTFVNRFAGGDNIPKLNLPFDYNHLPYFISLLENSKEMIELGLNTTSFNNEETPKAKALFQSVLDQINDALAIFKVKTNELDAMYKIYIKSDYRSFLEYISVQNKAGDKITSCLIDSAYNSTNAFLHLARSANNSLIQVKPHIQSHDKIIQTLRLIGDWASIQKTACDDMIKAVKLFEG